MLAWLAALAFALALVLHLIGHGTASLVLSFALAGLLCVALHMTGLGGYVTGRFRQPPPPSA